MPPDLQAHKARMDQLLNTLQQSDVKSVKQAWSSSPIRVGTVCSGTDSPMVALEALLSTLNNHSSSSDSNKMEMEHVFSCENVKFKRDFIEKTCNPPLIFNDLIELANYGRGVCHDGSTQVVPNDEELHFLIAGTECKDFSSLSSSRKGINGGGKSANTFWATHTLAKHLQPCIIILENVSQCPVKEMSNAFTDIGYTAVHTKVCTSDYYLPQSRSRKYFVFLNNNKTQFRASLTDDDWIASVERLSQQKNVLSWTSYLGIDDNNSSAAKPTQSKKKGGRGKPLSESLESKWLAEIKAIETKEGLTPYYAKGGRPYSDATQNIEAIASLPDRAKMRLDVQCKRAIKVGIDPFKVPLIWNPAQQLRYTHTGISSNDDGENKNPMPCRIAPCVTPKHEWIISSRMAPLTGAEALALQGLQQPQVLSKKVLSQFTCEQLRDLAGNAMSTTVVAAVFIATFLTTELIESNDSNLLVKRRQVSSSSSEAAAATVRTKKRRV